MKILLLNPNRISRGMLHVDPILTRCVGIPAKAPYLWPPMGLAYLAGYLRSEFEVTFLDAQAEDLSEEGIIRRVSHDLVVINTGMPTISQDLELARKINALGSKTALVGTHATYYHRQLIKEKGVDFIIRGEPELTCMKLAHSLENGQPLSGFPGLTWKQSGSVVMNSDPVPIQDLDDIPFSVRDMIPNRKYYDILAKRRPVTFSISSRGCPFPCRFCSAGIYNGRVFRARSASNVIQEATEASDQGFRDMSFIDDTFTINRKRVGEICSGLGKLDLSWRCLSRVDTVDRDMLKQMRDSGCYQIQFGVESGDPAILSRMKKGIQVQQIKKTFSDCQKLGIETVAFFIMGFPGETPASAERTVALSNELNPDFVTFNLFTPIPGSAEFEAMEPTGNWHQYDFTTTSFCDINSNRIASLAREAYRRYYLRPSYIFRRFRNTHQPIRVVKQNLEFWAMRRGTLWKSIMKS
jgi:radical SAM superfamily enzyme YgiQ (UPF0313 family)